MNDITNLFLEKQLPNRHNSYRAGYCHKNNLLFATKLPLGILDSRIENAGWESQFATHVCKCR